jgi:membrane protein
MSTFWYYLKNLYLKFNRDDVLFLSSGIAFNLMICAIPLILIIFSIAGFALSNSIELWDKTVLYIQSLLPVSSERIINNTQAIIRDRKLIGIIGLAGMAFTATRLFATLRTVLDNVFEVTHVRGFIHGTLFDLLMLLLLGMVIVLANLVFTFLPGILRDSILMKNSFFSLRPILKSSLVINSALFLFTAGLIFFSYKFFPSRRPRTGTCFIATLIAIVLIEITKHVYRYFLYLFPGFNRIYGTLAAIVAMIVGFYLFSMIYVIAAEFALIHERRTKIEPQPVTEPSPKPE